MSERVKFTVIIPTRERPDVLLHCLRTVVAQDYENLDIIVSDNFSQDNTKEVVESFSDSRIKYINPGKRVSMSHNWEFALSRVNDGYIMYLGDDDGILPGALVDISRIIEGTNAEAVGWRSAAYHWPRHPDEASRNMLSIPLGTTLERRIAGDVLADVLDMKRHYRELPHLYKGVVSYAPIQRVLRESGRFYWSLNPDVYSGVVVASVIDSYYYSHSPFSIDAASHHSIGSSYFSRNSDKSTAEKFLAEDNIPFHPKLVITQSLPVLVAECVLQAHDHVAASRRFPIDIKRVLEATVRRAISLPREQYEAVVDVVREIGRLNGLDESMPDIIKPHKQNGTRVLKPMLGINRVTNVLMVDCLPFRATNVFDAAMLCRHLLVLKERDYFSMRGVLRTTCGLLKRELLKRL